MLAFADAAACFPGRSAPPALQAAVVLRHGGAADIGAGLMSRMSAGAIARTDASSARVMVEVLRARGDGQHRSATASMVRGCVVAAAHPGPRREGLSEAEQGETRNGGALHHGFSRLNVDVPRDVSTLEAGWRLHEFVSQRRLETRRRGRLMAVPALRCSRT